MYPYPQSGDALEAIRSILAVRADLKNNLPVVLHAGWIVQGVAQSIGVPNGFGAAEFDEGSALAALDEVVASEGFSASADVSKIDWSKIDLAKILAAIQAIISIFKS